MMTFSGFFWYHTIYTYIYIYIYPIYIFHIYIPFIPFLYHLYPRKVPTIPTLAYCQVVELQRQVNEHVLQRGQLEAELARCIRHGSDVFW